jgi:hypothetical protein
MKIGLHIFWSVILLLFNVINTVPCRRYLTLLTAKYTVLGYWWPPIVLVTLQNTPFGLLHYFIYDSTSRHYNISLH